jgi:hypothetical protein
MSDALQTVPVGSVAPAPLPAPCPPRRRGSIRARGPRGVLHVRWTRRDPDTGQLVRFEESSRSTSREVAEQLLARRLRDPFVSKRARLTDIARKAMQRRQRHRCALCWRRVRSQVADHDHADGTVRGILCRTCNAALGQMGDSLEALVKAALYLAHARGSLTGPTRPPDLTDLPEPRRRCRRAGGIRLVAASKRRAMMPPLPAASPSACSALPRFDSIDAHGDSLSSRCLPVEAGAAQGTGDGRRG